LFPPFRQSLIEAGLSERLEIHVPRTRQAIELTHRELLTAGYHVAQEFTSNYQCFAFAREQLQYPNFGRTLHKIVNYRIASSTPGDTKQCTLFVNDSTHSALPTILELPNTLFMNYISDYRVKFLYPALTLNGRGLGNLLRAHGPGFDNSAGPWDDVLKASGFNVSDCLNDFPPYRQHRCGGSASCPLTQRREWDHVSVTQRFGAQQLGDRGIPYCYVSWTLKCGMTGHTTSDTAVLPTDYTVGRYIVHRSVYGECRSVSRQPRFNVYLEDTYTWWTTGDEDGHGRYNYELFNDSMFVHSDELSASQIRFLERYL
jgi:hypothetical protein